VLLTPRVPPHVTEFELRQAHRKAGPCREPHGGPDGLGHAGRGGLTGHATDRRIRLRPRLQQPRVDTGARSLHSVRMGGGKQHRHPTDVEPRLGQRGPHERPPEGDAGQCAPFCDEPDSKANGNPEIDAIP
jgi:hypothetical protein